MTEAEQAAQTFCESIKPKKAVDFDENDFLLWADKLQVNAVACTIDNPECESCSG